MRLLKMAVSVFFDLWENFYYTRYKDLSKKDYKKIDQRYTALFSILLDNISGKIKMDDNFKFISWNYDLQLEKAFQSFLLDNEVKNLEELNENYFQFKEDNKSINDVFHLNGHRGFFKNKDDSSLELNYAGDFNNYWKYLDNLLESTKDGSTNFDQYIKYAWEHKSDSEMYKSIINIFSETEVLIVIGYSFPPFNREVDQKLFSALNANRLKKIVYQDPTANSSIIENLFENPERFKNKIEVLNEDNSLTWFHLPNEHFMKPKSKFFGTDPIAFG
ncbi:hypothetical protein ACLI09_02940 [Flavobacterium sp. RHBU_24]|uniref:hypothetical protein n=1 Tax=Flavobacterium sp. RHBU_24 TaxID=3391185 RepID=UPI0039848A51